MSGLVQPPGNRGVEEPAALLHLPDCLAHHMGGHLLEQKAHGAGGGGGFDIRIITVRGEHDHLGVRADLEQLAGGFETIEPGHGDVHQDHVGVKLLHQIHRLAPVGRFADHFQAGLQLQHFAKPLTYDHVILG